MPVSPLAFRYRVTAKSEADQPVWPKGWIVIIHISDTSSTGYTKYVLVFASYERKKPCVLTWIAVGGRVVP